MTIAHRGLKVKVIMWSVRPRSRAVFSSGVWKRCFIIVLMCSIAVHQQQRKHLLAAQKQVYEDSEKLSIDLLADVSLTLRQCVRQYTPSTTLAASIVKSIKHRSGVCLCLSHGSDALAL